jgi:hypothetical protein
MIRSTLNITFAGIMLSFLTACAHETLSVPDHSQMLGSVQVNQVYRLQHETGIHVLDTVGEQPKINLWYWSGSTPPADAFQRIPFPIESPEADTTGYDNANLPAGTPISVTVAEIYPNCRVYIARVAGGELTNVHLLLVLPAKATGVPALAELQEQDKAYLIPVGKPATQPARSAGT